MDTGPTTVPEKASPLPVGWARWIWRGLRRLPLRLWCRVAEFECPPGPGRSSVVNNEVGWAFLDGRIGRALARCDREVRRHPKEALPYFNRASIYHAAFDYDRALADYDRAIELGVRGARAHHARGLVRQMKGDQVGAIEDFERVLARHPDHAETLAGRALSRLALGEREAAEEDIGRASALAPRSALIACTRGCCRAWQGRFEEAIEDFSLALRLDPRASGVYTNRGSAYQALARTDEALADYTTGIERAPWDAEAYQARAGLLVRLGECDRALADYEAALALRPERGELLICRGHCRLVRREFAAAAGDYRAALVKPLGEWESLAMNNLAWLLATCPEDALRDGPEAVRLATAACEAVEWTEAYCVGTLSAAYAEVGDFERARQLHEQATALLEPSERDAYRALFECYRHDRPCREPVMGVKISSARWGTPEAAKTDPPNRT